MKTIKKPGFLLPYFISAAALLAVFAAAAVIYCMPIFYLYEFQLTEEMNEKESNIREFFNNSLYQQDLSTNDIVMAKELLMNHYCETGQRYEVTIAGNVEDKIKLDASKTAILLHAYEAPDGEHDYNYLMLADNKYLKYFETPEVLAKSYNFGLGYSENFHHETQVQFECTKFYADLEKGLFIPVDVEILDWHGERTGITFTVTPDNTDGFQLVIPGERLKYYSTGTVKGYVPKEGEGSVEWTEDSYGNLYHSFECRKTPMKAIHFREAYGSRLDLAVVLICCGAFIFAFIPATIIYNVRMRRYQFYEYRSQMVDAMAHDLKTPMAAISAYAENLSNHIGTDKQEYYAGKFEEKVAQMNRIVNDILEFSKSEKQSFAITKENVDIDDVILKVISDNEHIISERSLKIDHDRKSVTVKTDENLFRQALANLIGNAVLYSREGSVIDIACDGKTLTITNDFDEEIIGGKDLRQPFVKGSNTRGSHGTGLGLAIAKNNLAMLGYKLEIKHGDGKFVASVKL